MLEDYQTVCYFDSSGISEIPEVLLNSLYKKLETMCQYLSSESSIHTVMFKIIYEGGVYKVEVNIKEQSTILKGKTEDYQMYSTFNEINNIDLLKFVYREIAMEYILHRHFSKSRAKQYDNWLCKKRYKIQSRVKRWNVPSYFNYHK